MSYLLLIVGLISLGSSVASGHALPRLYDRALPNAPNGYRPEAEDCPANRPTIRSAARLSPNETSWLQVRRNKTVEPMRDFLARLDFGNFDAASYIADRAQNASALPNIAIALSGGGYRALMNGGGVIQAFDSREENTTNDGHLGGLLQSSTYLAGLSGGGWLTGSIILNNFTTISELLRTQESSSVWEFQNSILTGPEDGGLQVLDSVEYYDDIISAVSSKDEAGFQTSATDYWGRALSYQLINATDGGPSYTWSSIALQESFVNGDTPLPILIANERAPGQLLIGGNATVFEFNPWELGTFDPSIHGFAPLRYLGSNFTNGSLPDDELCVRGFDNAGYIMGTSSSLFNQFLLQLDTADDVPDAVRNFARTVLEKFGRANNDIADYSPNPFLGFRNSSSSSRVGRLTLVDGGSDNQNIPLHPLIQPERHVDVIFAIDSSADTENNWPNGTAMVATYERSLTPLSNGTSFPSVPDQNTFVNLGLNTRPTFFGCDSSNTTIMTPLVVYIPNAPYVFNSNVSTLDLSHETNERNAIVQNGYAVATMGNGTSDEKWPVCVGCAILSRSLERTQTTVPDICRECFERYCWDGTVNSTQPRPYEPQIRLKAIETDEKEGRASGQERGAYLAATLAIAAMIMVGL